MFLRDLHMSAHHARLIWLSVGVVYKHTTHLHWPLVRGPFGNIPNMRAPNRPRRRFTYRGHGVLSAPPKTKESV